ncbi:nuclear protein Es2-domain-containing protein [Paraphysoderma sedebokerense]|nr:nuclear protein Es2-domain-containing protein [Paraphysoderma sedebokerense]
MAENSTEPTQSTALTKRSSSEAALVQYNDHRTVIPKYKPIVLDEDTYIEALSHIIQRDFFPDLKRLKTETDYYTALEFGDLEKIKSLQWELEKLKSDQTNNDNTSSSTIKAASVESQLLNQPPSSSLPSDINLSLSLDAFQTKYTSEDNASFSEILDKMNEKKRERYRWIYDKEKQKLALEGPKPGDDSGRPALIQSWDYTAKNALMYIPDGVALDVSTMLNEKSRKAAPSVTHSATRFSETSTKALQKAEDTANEQPQVAISGEPQVNGFGFVDSTPAPHPSTAELPPMFTWGSIEGTPMLVNGTGNETPGGPSFKFPETRRRDELGRKLSEQASRSIRKKGWTPSSSSTSHMTFQVPTPRFANGCRSRGESSDGSETPRLSDAAAKLLKKTTGRSANLHSADQQLRASYSSATASGRIKTPGRTPGATPWSSRSNATPHLLHTPSSSFKPKQG